MIYFNFKNISLPKNNSCRDNYSRKYGIWVMCWRRSYRNCKALFFEIEPHLTFFNLLTTSYFFLSNPFLGTSRRRSKVEGSSCFGNRPLPRNFSHVKIKRVRWLCHTPLWARFLKSQIGKAFKNTFIAETWLTLN